MVEFLLPQGPSVDPSWTIDQTALHFLPGQSLQGVTDTLPLTWAWLLRGARSFAFLCAHQRLQPRDCVASATQREAETAQQKSF